MLITPRSTFGTSTSRAAAWPKLRALRAVPPGRALRGARKEVFSSALEQAEQLFRAAADVGYASRPLLLFYGLSQAGRAIAAASTSAGNNGWRLSGHGISAPNLNQGPVLHELRIVDDAGGGSFIQLAPLLNSGTLPRGATLGQVWMTIPDLLRRPLGPGALVYAPALDLSLSGAGDDGLSRGFLTAFGPPFPSVQTDQEVQSLIDRYPSITGHQVWPGSEISRSGDHINIPRAWRVPADQNSGDMIGAMTQPYTADDDRWVYPAIGGADRPIRPLLAWWAVLFALSMLARYVPSSWIHHINVDESRDAVALEAALESALDVCPELVYRAIRAVS
jgi:hypothetical protein